LLKKRRIRGEAYALVSATTDLNRTASVCMIVLRFRTMRIESDVSWSSAAREPENAQRESALEADEG
jgi:hypothetical protein